ncbi:uncharacterized protein LOC134259393 [Saccostrea cucullata]|uniref:uncharacterized protein LOC134259393 n=1 Tax=Saccostrea cuccullata TaxID=36930 RepID=UPI002ED58E42
MTDASSVWKKWQEDSTSVRRFGSDVYYKYKAHWYCRDKEGRNGSFLRKYNGVGNSIEFRAYMVFNSQKKDFVEQHGWKNPTPEGLGSIPFLKMSGARLPRK